MILLILLTTVGCQSGGKETSRSRERVDALVPTAGAGARDRLSMQRGSCYRSCAQYTVTVTGAGAVSYNGIANVARVGEATRAIAASAAAALMAFADSIGVLTMPDSIVVGTSSCGPATLDLPRVTITFERAGSTRTVVHDYGCSAAPPGLRRLHERIDSVSGVKTWIGNS